MKHNRKSQQEISSGGEFERLSNKLHIMTGQKAKRFFFPGLKNRYKSGRGSAVVTTTGGEKLIMTFRDNVRLAELEAVVIDVLSKSNAPVPRLIARNGQWLVQEYLGELRLTQILHTEPPEAQIKLIEKAILSLAKVQEVAKKVGLHKRTKAICMDQKWMNKRIDSPNLLGKTVKIPAPLINKNDLHEALIVDPNTFIKWDARAGNAIVQNDGSICWFDWEHSGCRSPVDDLVWFLSDEWVPSNDSLEMDFLENYFHLFKAPGLKVAAQRYLFIHGTLHMCGRLVEILGHKGAKNWWSRDYCLEFEQMGVTLTEACNLASKASEWAGRDKLTEPLSAWLRNVDAYLRGI